MSQSVSTKQAKSSFKIAVMGGDGTGPEVVNEGLKVLKALGQSLKLNFEWIPYDLGAVSYTHLDVYKRQQPYLDPWRVRRDRFWRRDHSNSGHFGDANPGVGPA